MNTYAVIDIGTLKVKTEIANVTEDKLLNRIYNSNTLTCFGVGLDENNGNVKEKYLQNTIDELKRIKQVLKEHKVEKFKVVSTHAMRNAKNREYIIDTILKKTGFIVENISQEQEAQLFFKAVMNSFVPSEQEYAIVDVGGGSVQVLIGNSYRLRTSALLGTGTISLTEKVVKNPHSPMSMTTHEDIEKMKQLILDELITIGAGENIPVVYGSSMIIDVMKKINLPLETHENSTTHPYKTYVAHLRDFLNKVLPYTMQDREKLHELPHGFMWGIDKGFLNILTISEYLKSPYIIPSNANIAQGVIYTLAEAQ